MAGKSFVGRLALATALVLGAMPSSAQTTTCATGNCAAGMTAGSPNLPAQCQNIATPRTIEISMTSAPLLRFVPSTIRIEGESATSGVPWSYQCIMWHKVDSAVIPWHSTTEDTAGSFCDLSDLCSSTNLTPPCDWETGNIDNTLEYGVCHYASVAIGTYDFRCRLHQAFGMVGFLTVVQPIQLLVDRDVNDDPDLSWNTCGVGSWNVWRDTSGSMPSPTNLTVGGTSLRALTDSAAGTAAYYLVTELTTGCGNGVKEGMEACDGADLGAETCVTQGFDAGTLACNATCGGFVTSNCTTCGDTVCEILGGLGGEDCVTCPADCNGVQMGMPASQFCCGDAGGTNPVDCTDTRCTDLGNTCTP